MPKCVTRAHVSSPFVLTNQKPFCMDQFLGINPEVGIESNQLRESRSLMKYWCISDCISLSKDSRDQLNFTILRSQLNIL